MTAVLIGGLVWLVVACLVGVLVGKAIKQADHHDAEHRSDVSS